MTNIFVFLGPSLPVEEAKAHLDAVYLPPVEQGDVYSLLPRDPRVILIVDGYFENRPAVWHKEILYAMAKGVHVIGASSMGALRAAELDAFGMEGVGEVYEWYRTGVLEADDEVAVRHASSADGFLNLSVALVNIRKTLQRAVEDGVISEDSRRKIIGDMRATFYPERTYENLLRRAEGVLPRTEWERLGPFLSRNRVDLKKQDAVLALKKVRAMVESGVPPKEVAFDFLNTVWFDRLTSQKVIKPEDGPGSLSELGVVVYANLHLPDFVQMVESAMTRHLAVQWARTNGIVVSDQDIQAAANEFRRARGLQAPGAAAQWLLRNNVSEDDFAAILEELALEKKIRAFFNLYMDRPILNALKLAGKFPETLEAYAQREKRIGEAGLDRFAGDGRARVEVLAKRFFELRRQPVPEDLREYCRKIRMHWFYFVEEMEKDVLDAEGRGPSA